MNKRTAFLTTCAAGLALAVPATASAAPPANDAFATPQLLTAQGLTQGTMAEATVESAEPKYKGKTRTASVWYAFVAPADGLYILDTCNTAFDTILGVYQGSALGQLREVVINDDYCGRGSRVTFEAKAGQAYRVAIVAFRQLTEDDEKTFSLNFKQAVRPDNDAFARAVKLTGPGRIAGTNALTTKELGEPIHARNGTGHSVWYRYKATKSQTLTFDTLGSSFDTVLAVYRGTIGSLKQVAANDDANGEQGSEVRIKVKKGSTYFIAVDGSESDESSEPEGDFNLGLSDGGIKGTGLSLTIPGSPSLNEVRTGGLDVSLRCIRICKVDIELKVGERTAKSLGLGKNRVIAKRSGTLTGGELGATLQLSKKAAAKLKGKSQLNASVVVRLRGTDSKDRTLSKSLTISN